MELSPDTSNEVVAFLQSEAASGKRWVVFEEGTVIKNVNTLRCFQKEFDAEQYAHDNTSTYDRMVNDSLKNALRSIYQTLINRKFMNTQNLEFLQSNLKYFGFGDKLNEALEKNIRDEKNEFQLKIEIPHFNNKMDYTLHFKKSDSTDMYFFNRYDASLQNGKPEMDKNQCFYINKGSGVTAKEAFNLLEGRSVHKELVNKDGEKYNAWLKLDFENFDERGNSKLKQFTDQYGYDLEKNLAAYPIKELGDDEQKKQLINSLQKGNVQQVTIEKDGKEAKHYIEAVPQFKNINVYDQKMHVVRRQSVQTIDISDGQSASKNLKPGKDQKQKADAEDGKPSPKKSRQRKLTA
ncbi:MAG: hypothetical protein ACO1NS_05545 [Daejeonella sp.]